MYVTDQYGKMFQKLLKKDGSTQDLSIYIPANDQVKFEPNSVYIAGARRVHKDLKDVTDTEELTLYLNDPNGDKKFSAIPELIEEFENRLWEQTYIWSIAENAASAEIRDEIRNVAHIRADVWRNAEKGNFTDGYQRLIHREYLAKAQYGNYTYMPIVEEIQDMLEYMGYSFKKTDNGENDGKYGEETFKNVALFQVKHKQGAYNELDVTGYLNQQTYDLIEQREYEAKLAAASRMDMQTLKEKQDEYLQEEQEKPSYVLGLYSTLTAMESLSIIKYEAPIGNTKIGITFGNITYTDDEQNFDSELGQQRLRYLRDLVVLNPAFNLNQKLFNDNIAWLKQIRTEASTTQVKSLISQATAEYNDILGPEIKAREEKAARSRASFVLDLTTYPALVKSAGELFKGSDLITDEPIPGTQRYLNVGFSVIPVFGGIIKNGGKIGQKVIVSGKTLAAFTDELRDILKVEEKLAVPQEASQRVSLVQDVLKEHKVQSTTDELGLDLSLEIEKKYVTVEPAKGAAKGLKEVKYGEHFKVSGGKKVDLAPNVKYKSPSGHAYTTDEFGRITSVEGELKLGNAPRNKDAQRTIGGKDRLPDDDGGHLIASEFNGSGEIDNLVPMNAKLNRSGGKWRSLEGEWEKALKAGQKVSVKIEPVYNGESMRPIKFDIEYTIDGKTKNVILNNQSGG